MSRSPVPAEITVLPIGSDVAIGPDDDRIDGTITAVMIEGYHGHVSYRVAWWQSRDRKSEWLNACEVRPRSSGVFPGQRIGFNKPSEDSPPFRAGENRTSQEEFLCVSCGMGMNADKNAALNIRARALSKRALELVGLTV